MQQINKIIQPFSEILALCCFGEGSACCLTKPNKCHIITLKLPEISNYMQKKLHLPQIVFEKLKNPVI